MTHEMPQFQPNIPIVFAINVGTNIARSPNFKGKTGLK